MSQLLGHAPNKYGFISSSITVARTKFGSIENQHAVTLAIQSVNDDNVTPMGSYNKHGLTADKTFNLVSWEYYFTERERERERE